MRKTVFMILALFPGLSFAEEPWSYNREIGELKVISLKANISINNFGYTTAKVVATVEHDECSGPKSNKDIARTQKKTTIQGVSGIRYNLFYTNSSICNNLPKLVSRDIIVDEIGLAAPGQPPYYSGGIAVSVGDMIVLIP